MSNYNSFAMPTPRPQSVCSEASQVHEGFSRKNMNVKVLYTFDQDHKNSHLARLPLPMNVPTIRVDDTTQIGVVDLKTCIDAVLSASPEIQNKASIDYTVYAHDFSEEGSPLVGHGLLSLFVASHSTQDMSSANSLKVTGRVSMNLLFQETLEIKIRLAPFQSQSSHSRRPSLANMTQDSSNSAMSFPTNNGTYQRNMGMDAFQQLMSPTAEPLLSPADLGTFRSDSLQWDQPGPESSFDPISRCSSVNLNADQAQQNAALDLTRPLSRVSNGSESVDLLSQTDGDPTFNEEFFEGPSRKRARVTPADWNGRSTFGSARDSLRVAASTAASIRLHRPVPRNPAAARIDSIEPPPREPTPRPQAVQRRATSSTLRHESSTDQAESVADSPPRPVSRANTINNPNNKDSPVEFPSSPPMFAVACDAESTQSSPMPVFEEELTPAPNDSGFMSDAAAVTDSASTTTAPVRRVSRATPGFLPPRQPTLDELKKMWKENDAEKEREKERAEAANEEEEARERERKREKVRATERERRKRKRAQEKEEKERAQGLAAQDGQAIDLEDTTTPPSSSSGGRKDPRRHTVSPESLAVSAVRRESISIASSNTALREGPKQAGASMTRPSTPIGERFPPNRNMSLARSQSFTVGWQPKPVSVAYEPGATGIPQPRSGSGAKRRKIIEDRLAECIQNGEMPPFCDNCGVIRTPTWRRAYSKIIEGEAAEAMPTEQEKQNIVGREVLEEVNGKVVKVKICKKTLLDGENKDDYELLTFCNPCGLWFYKKGDMRPESMWKDPTPGTRNRRPKHSLVEIHSDMSYMNSDSISPADAHQGTKSVAPEAASGDQSVNRPSENSHHREVQDRNSTTAADAAAAQKSSNEQGVTHDNDRLAAELFKTANVEPSKRPRESEDDDAGHSSPAPTRRLLFPSPDRPAASPLERRQTRSMSKSPAQSPSKKTQLATSPKKARHLANTTEAPDKENATPSRSVVTTPGKTIPSSLRDIFSTPRSGQFMPVTPFTEKVNAILSEGDFPTFDTPAKNDFDPTSDFDALLTSPSTNSRGSGSRSMADNSKILEELWADHMEWNAGR